VATIFADTQFRFFGRRWKGVLFEERRGLFLLRKNGLPKNTAQREKRSELTGNKKGESVALVQPHFLTKKNYFCSHL
jgi:hypothetical protein